MARTEQILEGYAVLDFTQAVAGPVTTLRMAEMGAEVIKVEFAPRGDPTRYLPFIHNGRSGLFVQHNRGKKSLALDLKSPTALAIIKELIPKMDVVVENFTPGVIGRMGLGYQALAALNPKIVMCSISAFGQTGPLAQNPGYDAMGAAITGFSASLGEADRPPPFPQSAAGDIGAGAYALAAIGYALLHRERKGKGQYLDVSLVDAYFTYYETAVEVVTASKGSVKRARSGGHSMFYGACGHFKGKQHYFLIVAVIPKHFSSLCEAMGQPELASNPRFIDNPKRVENRAALTELIENWLASQPSDEAAMRILNQHHVPVTLALSLEEAIDDPHLRQRGTVQTVNDPILGEFQVPGFPLKFSDTPGAADLVAPFFGEHNHETLMKHLGYTADRIKKLKQQGILHREEIPSAAAL